MAFVCVIRAEQFQADTFRDGSKWAIIINIGYDDAKDHRYSLVVGLEPSGGGEIEFFFHIVRADGETGEEFPYWCGKDVAAFIGKGDRHVILAHLLTATDVLLKNAQPVKVFFFTHDENPPEKALLKHYAVVNVFKRCGYEVKTFDVYHGRRTWSMEQSANFGIVSLEINE